MPANFYGLTPFSWQDFPNHLSCILWLPRCNMRCLYCHNPDIVDSKHGNYTQDEFFTFLQNRVGKLEGVVLSGGEATLFPELEELIVRIKSLGFRVKLDTNGLRPELIETLLHNSLLDYLALDYKAPEMKFQAITGAKHFDYFLQTLNLLCLQKKLNFEVRTTVHADLLDEGDVQKIVDDLADRGFCGSYFIQNYQHSETLGSISKPTRAFEKDKIEEKGELKIEFRNF